LTPASIAISNLGMYGMREFTGIINPPAAAILAIGSVRSVSSAGEGGRNFAMAKVMSITLSSDHRLIDGALAACSLRFQMSTSER